MTDTHYICKIVDTSYPLKIFFHGFTADMTIFSNIVQNLAGNYLLLDFYGHGKSKDREKITTELLVNQVDGVLKTVLSEHEIKDLQLIGHSQGAVFAARFTLMSNYSFNIKSLMLITPGGVDFQPQDLYNTPWHIVPRLLHYFGTFHLTQKLAIQCSASALDYLHYFSSDEKTKTWIEDFRVFNIKCKDERNSYFTMIGSMLDNLDLLKDQKEIYRLVARRKSLWIDLVIGSSDVIVTKSAALRLAKVIGLERDKFGLHLFNGGHDILVSEAKEIAELIAAGINETS